LPSACPSPESFGFKSEQFAATFHPKKCRPGVMRRAVPATSSCCGIFFGHQQRIVASLFGPRSGKLDVPKQMTRGYSVPWTVNPAIPAAIADGPPSYTIHSLLFCQRPLLPCASFQSILDYDRSTLCGLVCCCGGYSEPCSVVVDREYGLTHSVRGFRHYPAGRRLRQAETSFRAALIISMKHSRS